MKNLMQEFVLIEQFTTYLKNKNVSFTDEGFPVFQKSMFVEEIPELIIPFYHRNSRLVNNAAKTAICFYEGDKNLYPRFKKIFSELQEYEKFLGVVGIDVTVTSDMDKEWQDVIMLLNQLFLMILAVNGIIIIPNLRCGIKDTEKNFFVIPKNVICAVGFLGCEKQKFQNDFAFITKVLFVQPSKLLIYGKHDKLAENNLNTMGIYYKNYKDYHSLCKTKEV